jgi:hypothetical protein
MYSLAVRRIRAYCRDRRVSSGNGRKACPLSSLSTSVSGSAIVLAQSTQLFLSPDILLPVSHTGLRTWPTSVPSAHAPSTPALDLSRRSCSTLPRLRYPPSYSSSSSSFLLDGSGLLPPSSSSPSESRLFLPELPQYPSTEPRFIDLGLETNAFSSDWSSGTIPAVLILDCTDLFRARDLKGYALLPSLSSSDESGL